MSEAHMRPEWRRICCPVDFSECSNAALEQAAVLAKRYRAHLTLLHVCPDPTVQLPNGTVLPSLDVLGKLEQTAAADLVEWKERALALGAPEVTISVVVGTPFRAIVAFARSDASELVVMGTHGRSGLKRLVLGSVAERVLRLAPCPVLTVSLRPHAAHPERVTCAELMRSQVELVHTYDTLQSAAQKMLDGAVAFLPVCDPEGHLVGTISDLDLLSRAVADDRVASESRVEDHMLRSPPVCRPDENVRSAAERMAALGVRRLVVVDIDGAVLGVLSRSDFPPEAAATA